MGKIRERKREEDQCALGFMVMLDVLRSGTIAAAMALAVLAVAAGLISAGVLSDVLSDRIVIAACLTGTFLGGLMAVLRRPNMAIVIGLGVGVVMFFLLSTAGVLLYDSVPGSQGSGAILCACLCGGGLSGILAGKPKKKRRK